MARSPNLDNFHVWAQETVRKGVTDNLVDVPVLLAAFSRKGRVTGTFGQLNAAMTIGASLPNIAGVSTSGGTLKHITFRKSQGGGGKVLGADGNRASSGTDRYDKHWQSAYFHWSHREYAMAIRNEALRQAAGSGKRTEVGDLVSRTTMAAMSDFIGGTTNWTGFAESLYTGNPSNQSTDEPWDDIVGLQQWIHDSNTLGGVNRSSVSGFSGVRKTSAISFTLDLIDEAMIDHDGSGNGLLNKQAKPDLWVMGNTIYRKAKQEAIARNGMVTYNAMPEKGEIGFLNEYINYNGKMIVLDPYCPSSHVFGLDSRTWEFEVDPAYNFKVNKFTDMASIAHGSGQPDITTSSIELRARTLCFDPSKNIQYTNVS